MREKNGETIPGICKKYGCSEEALRQRIEQLFNSKDGARVILKQLKGNGKKAKPARPAETAGGEPIAQTMEKLQRLAEKHDKVLSKLEEAYRAYQERRQKCDKTLAEIYAEMQQSGVLVANRAMEEQRAIAEDKKLVSLMNRIVVTHRAKLAELEDIDRQIEELSKITICVYTDGEISPFDESIKIAFDETGCSKIFSKAQKLAGANKFNQWDIELASRVIAIIKNLGSLQPDIVFENRNTEDAYLAIAGLFLN